MEEFYKHLNKTIPGWKGYYKINIHCEVLSLKRNKLLYINKTNANGYNYVNLNKNGKGNKYSIHRLMALTFLVNDDPINKIWVNHKNGNKGDNSLTNLEWITPKDNKRHAINKGLQVYKRGEDNKNAVLSDKQIEWVRKLSNVGYNKSNICEIMGVSRTLIHYIIDKNYR
jgi:hypothetical protein